MTSISIVQTDPSRAHRALACLLLATSWAIACGGNKGDSVSRTPPSPAEAGHFPGVGKDSQAEACNTATVVDPALDAEIRSVLDVPAGPIPRDQQQRLTHLSVAGVGSLAGLECFDQLARLMLHRGAASDLTPIAGLDQLEDLDIAEHPVEDLSPLSGLSKLRSLHVVVGPLADISPLAALPALEMIWLRGTRIADISPLASHDRLQVLDIGYTQVSSLAPLSSARALAFLSISGTPVTDLSPIQFPPGASALCPEIRAQLVAFDQRTLDDVIPALCGSGWSVTWHAPGEAQQHCGVVCRI